MNREIRSLNEIAELLNQSLNGSKTVMQYQKKERLFSQGEPAHFVFYIQTGRVKLSVLSPTGKEGIIGILEPGQLVGELCLSGLAYRMKTATAMVQTSAIRIEKAVMERLLHLNPRCSTSVLKYVLSRNIQSEENLVDQLFHTSEKRLARLLLTLSQVTEDCERNESVVPKISQEALGEMIGATRETVNSLMNKFKKLGYVEYSDTLCVKKSLSLVISKYP